MFVLLDKFFFKFTATECACVCVCEYYMCVLFLVPANQLPWVRFQILRDNKLNPNCLTRENDHHATKKWKIVTKRSNKQKREKKEILLKPDQNKNRLQLKLQICFVAGKLTLEHISWEKVKSKEFSQKALLSQRLNGALKGMQEFSLSPDGNPNIFSVS